MNPYFNIILALSVMGLSGLSQAAYAAYEFRLELERPDRAAVSDRVILREDRASVLDFDDMRVELLPQTTEAEKKGGSLLSVGMKVYQRKNGTFISTRLPNTVASFGHRVTVSGLQPDRSTDFKISYLVTETSQPPPLENKKPDGHK